MFSFASLARSLSEVVAPPPMDAPIRVEDAEATRAFLDRFDNFLCDCDGVLWMGGKLLPQVTETMELLTRLGKTVVFITNNSTKSRVQYREKLAGLGLVSADFPTDRIVTSASAAAEFLQEHHPSIRKVYVVGECGVVDELALAGIEAVTESPDAKCALSEEEFEAFVPDPDIGAVVCGWDRAFSFRKMCIASLYLQRGCVFIGTNPDATDKLPDRFIPGNGCALAAISTSCGKSPIITGKPSGSLITRICARLGLERTKTCMIGDRLDTDILFGHNGGVTTVLVMSGTTSEDGLDKVCRTCSRVLGDYATVEERMAQSKAFKLKPEYVFSSFGMLAQGDPALVIPDAETSAAEKQEGNGGETRSLTDNASADMSTVAASVLAVANRAYADAHAAGSTLGDMLQDLREELTSEANAESSEVLPGGGSGGDDDKGDNDDGDDDNGGGQQASSPHKSSSSADDASGAEETPSQQQPTAAAASSPEKSEKMPAATSDDVEKDDDNGEVSAEEFVDAETDPVVGGDGGDGDQGAAPAEAVPPVAPPADVAAASTPAQKVDSTSS